MFIAAKVKRGKELTLFHWEKGKVGSEADWAGPLPQ